MGPIDVGPAEVQALQELAEKAKKKGIPESDSRYSALLCLLKQASGWKGSEEEEQASPAGAQILEETPEANRVGVEDEPDQEKQQAGAGPNDRFKVVGGADEQPPGPPEEPEVAVALGSKPDPGSGLKKGDEEGVEDDGRYSVRGDDAKQLRAQRIALAFLARNRPMPAVLYSQFVQEGGEKTEAAQTAWPEGQEGPDAESAYAKQTMEQFHQRLLEDSTLQGEKDRRLQQKLQSRLKELQHLPAGWPLVLHKKAAIERKALQLTALQRKLRFEVSAEVKFLERCKPDTLLDWGMMRLRKDEVLRAMARADPERISHGVACLSHPLLGLSLTALETEEKLRKKREMDRLQRTTKDTRRKVAGNRRIFFTELVNFHRDWPAIYALSAKRLKQRNDGVLAWHNREAKRANRAERLRVQALKNDDQEAYMKLVEESKNERLRTLLGKTDELLMKLNQMVQLQKEADDWEPRRRKKHKEGPLEGPDAEPNAAEIAGSSRGETVGSPKKKGVKNGEEVGSPKAKGKDITSPRKKGLEDLRTEQEKEADEQQAAAIRAAAATVAQAGTKRDLLAGQRAYNETAHAIQEKVLVQPAMLEGGTLRSYQLEGLQWMLSLYNNNLNGILADEMGLGKTIQTISLLAYLFENKGLKGPHLIVAPKAVLPNWAHEFKTWAPTMDAVLYDGNLEERRAIQRSLAGKEVTVLLTHYDLVMRDKTFLKKTRWHYLIVDEGHRLKNHESMLARTIVTTYHIRRRILLTGTPIQNSLNELWSLLNFLLPNIFNNSQNFEEWFNAPFADRGDLSLTEEEELLVIRRLHQVLRPFLLRRKKSEVEKELPKKKQVVLKCDLSAWQRAYYKQIVDLGAVGLESTTGKSKSLQNTAMQLRKCCNHPFLFLEHMDYTPEDQTVMIRASGKFELLDRLLPKLKAAKHRILLFSQMTRLMDILEDYLEYRNHKYLRLDGNTKTDERGQLLNSFNAEDSPYFIFLLSTRAGGLGLNLQSADTVILFDSDWNPQMDQQAEDRAHRIGQKKEVRVFVLVSVGSIEEEILERARSKMNIDAKVIQAGLFNTMSTAQERKELLEEIMRRGTNTLGRDIPSEEEINCLSARDDDELELFEQMDAERRAIESGRAPLLTEEEVPEWVFAHEQEALAAEGSEEAQQAGNKRKRKEVTYQDVLSDEQWLKVVEEGGDLAKIVEEKQEKRKKLKAKRLEKQAKLAAEGEDGEKPQEEKEEEPEEEEGKATKVKKKKSKGKENGEKPKGEKQKAEEDKGKGVKRKQKASEKEKKQAKKKKPEEEAEKLEEEPEEDGVKKKKAESKDEKKKKKKSSQNEAPAKNVVKLKGLKDAQVKKRKLSELTVSERKTPSEGGSLKVRMKLPKKRRTEKPSEDGKKKKRKRDEANTQKEEGPVAKKRLRSSQQAEEVQLEGKSDPPRSKTKIEKGAEEPPVIEQEKPAVVYERRKKAQHPQEDKKLTVKLKAPKPLEEKGGPEMQGGVVDSQVPRRPRDGRRERGGPKQEGEALSEKPRTQRSSLRDAEEVPAPPNEGIAKEEELEKEVGGEEVERTPDKPRIRRSSLRDAAEVPVPPSEEKVETPVERRQSRRSSAKGGGEVGGSSLPPSTNGSPVGTPRGTRRTRSAHVVEVAEQGPSPGGEETKAGVSKGARTKGQTRAREMAPPANVKAAKQGKGENKVGDEGGVKTPNKGKEKGPGQEKGSRDTRSRRGLDEVKVEVGQARNLRLSLRNTRHTS